MTTLAGRMMLQHSPLFRGLTPPALERVAALATQRRYREGEVVCSQGDPGDALYGLVTGRVRISTGDADGREIFLNIMEPGDTFGEIALLDGGVRTATAVAMVPSELVALRRDHLMDLLQREPQVALELLRLCGQRLRWTSGLLEDAVLLDASARLAKRLLSLGQLHGRRTARGLTLRISQEALASFLGVTRQSVNQQLQDWRARGLVELGRGVVTVRDEGAFRSAVNSGRMP
jgi:CRP-like cAMP-binding protein